MSRYRKTMRQAIEEGLSNMQIAILKKEYAPLKGKKITAARAKQLMNILDRFKEDDLKKLGKENIPFVSSGSRSKLAVRNMKFKVTSINPFKEEVTQEDFDLEEGKMSQIDAMQKDGKSAAEIAKLMKLDVKTVKAILGEEEIHEFKKMTVTFKSMADMAKASTDLAKHGFTIDAKGMVMKVDGKGADLNKYATDLKNFYKASIRAESYSIDESADEDFYNPVTEACWTGYKQVGMKDKGGKQVPNCVPEETVKEDKDHEISMARGELEAIADKATKLSSMLQGKSDEGNPLEAWVQSKITKAKDYINSVADYMEYTPDLGEDKEVPPIDKDNAPGVKIAKIRAMNKEDDKEKDKSKDTIASLKDQIQMLKTKLENEARPFSIFIDSRLSNSISDTIIFIPPWQKEIARTYQLVRSQGSKKFKKLMTNMKRIGKYKVMAVCFVSLYFFVWKCE